MRRIVLAVVVHANDDAEEHGNCRHGCHVLFTFIIAKKERKVDKNNYLGIGVTKTWPEEGHTREWPDEITMSDDVKAQVDVIWSRLGLGATKD